MEGLFLLLGLMAFVGVVVLPILGAVAFARTIRLRAEVAALRLQLDRIAAGQAAAEPAAAEPPEWRAESPAESPPEAQAEPPATPQPVPPRPEPLPVAARELAGGERLAARWTVRIGGIAIALGGIYLVKYSIDMGLLGPAARIVLALLLGAGLVAAGEWLRRRMAVEPPGRGGEQVPPALAGAGVAIAFGAVYAAHALYGLIGTAAAFVALALVAFAALVLALRQGVLLAALGLAAAYAVPLLVESEAPDALALFTYLLAVTAACLAVIRQRAWVWLVWATVAGATAWVPLWFTFSWQEGDALAIGPYLVLLTVLFALLPARARGAAAEISPPHPAALAVPEQATLVASALIAALAFGLLRMDAYSGLALGVFVIAALAWILAGRRWQSLDVAPWPWALAAVAAVAAHRIPELLDYLAELGPGFGRPGAAFPDIGVPPEASGFLGMTAGFGLLFAAAGFTAQWRAQAPGRWAVLAAATPLLLLALAYQRLTGFAPSPPFAGAALALAVLFSAATERTARHGPEMTPALAAYASAVLGAITLALAMLLRDGWLTVAFAWQLPALAWVWRRTRIAGLRTAALAVGALVLVRLLLNEFVLDYAFGSTPVVNGLLIAYGLPLVAFVLARRMFDLPPEAALARLLHIGAVAFGVALATLEIRHAAHGGNLREPGVGLGEAGALAAAWGIGGLVLLRRDRAWPDPVPRVCGLLLAMGAGCLVLAALTSLNPLATGEPAPDWPLVNALGLAYGLPALLALAYGREAMLRGLARGAQLGGAAALLLGFVLVSLEVRRAFTPAGEAFDATEIGVAEAYTYSAVWLLYAIALFAGGIALRRPVLRHVGLAAVALVAAKVFLLDMANLEGLYRVASFLGLGAALIGVGWVHQRTLVREREQPG